MPIFHCTAAARACLPLAIFLATLAAPSLSLAGGPIVLADGESANLRFYESINAPGGVAITALGHSPLIALNGKVNADRGILAYGTVDDVSLSTSGNVDILGEFHGYVGSVITSRPYEGQNIGAGAIIFKAGVGSFSNVGRLNRIIFEGRVGSFENGLENKPGAIDGNIQFMQGVTEFFNGQICYIFGTIDISGGGNTLKNNGQIIAVGVGIRAGGSGSLLNMRDGYISGRDALVLSGGWTITNNGTIRGRSGIAVQLGPEDDTVILAGSGSFQGLVDFGGGNDTLDLSQQDGSTTIEVANLGRVTGSNNYLQIGNKLYVTETRASGSGVLSASAGSVTGALNTVIDGALAGDLFTSLEDSNPIAYAAQPSLGAAADATKSAATNGKTRFSQRAWITAFGGGSTAGDLSSVFGGIVAGSHVRLNDSLDLGLLAAYTRSSAKTDGDHELTADTFLFGPYGQLDLGGAELTFSLIGGISANASARAIDADVASASFSSLFVAPSLGAEIPVLTGYGASLSLTAGATYVSGLVAGYSETGSSQDLTLGQQTLGQFDSRIGAVAKFDLGTSHHTFRAGGFQQVHTGSASVPVTLLGTTRSLDTTQANGYGLYAGYALKVDLANSLSLTTAIDGSWRNDGQLTGAARIKLMGEI